MGGGRGGVPVARRPRSSSVPAGRRGGAPRTSPPTSYTPGTENAGMPRRSYRAPPAIALPAIVLGVLRVADQAEAASELGAANRLLQARGQVADAATALRLERDRASAFLAEKRLGDRGPLQDAVRATDTAIEQIRTNIPAGELDTATRNAVEQAQGGFSQLAVLRADVDGNGPLLASDVTSRYSGVIARTDVL